MKEQTWLIRTKQNKILGPLAKGKVIELVKAKSLTAEDELCSGNGYWFWVKEKELLDKYLFGDMPQSFNPISEAETLFCASDAISSAQSSTFFQAPAKVEESVEDEEDIIFPEDNDLDYPELIAPESAKPSTDIVFEVGEKKDLTPKIEVKSKAKVKAEEPVIDEPEEELLLPKVQDLEYPEIVVTAVKEPAKEEVQDKIEISSLDESVDDIKAILNSEREESNSEDEIPSVPKDSKSKEVDFSLLSSAGHEDEIDETPIRNIQEIPRPRKKKRRRKKVRPAAPLAPKRNDRLVFYILALILTGIFYGVFYYYTEILGQNVFGKLANTLVKPAYAQDLPGVVKKK